MCCCSVGVASAAGCVVACITAGTAAGAAAALGSTDEGDATATALATGAATSGRTRYSMPLNTSRQLPQRTRLPRSFN